MRTASFFIACQSNFSFGHPSVPPLCYNVGNIYFHRKNYLEDVSNGEKIWTNTRKMGFYLSLAKW